MAGKGEVVDVHAFINARGFSHYQWFILALCFLIVFVDGFDNAAMGYVAPALVGDWGIERADLAPILSAAPFGLAIGALLAGPFADKLGRKTVLIASAVVFGVGSLASTRAAGVEELLVMRLFTGLGIGALMPAATTLMSEYVPERRRSLLVVTMFSGFTLGASGGGFAAALLIQDYGWRSIFFVGGVAPLLLAGLLAAFLPESARFLIVRERAGARIAAILNRMAPGSVGPDQTFTVPEQAVGKPRNPVAAILRGRLMVGTLMLWVAYFMGLVGIIVLQSWMPTLMGAEGYDQKTGANVTALFQLGGTGGALLVGYCMDRFGGHKAITISYVLGGLLIFGMAQTFHSVALVAVTVLLAGFFSSGAQTSLSALAANFYPTQVRGTGVSWMLGVGRWGAVLGAFIGGPMLKLGWDAQIIFSTLLIPLALAAAAVAVKGSTYRSAPATHLADAAPDPR
jgi:AAHS family 4-hydroxybenzoate transporter-like MFS transporter